MSKRKSRKNSNKFGNSIIGGLFALSVIALTSTPSQKRSNVHKIASEASAPAARGALTVAQNQTQKQEETKAQEANERKNEHHTARGLIIAFLICAMFFVASGLIEKKNENDKIARYEIAKQNYVSTVESILDEHKIKYTDVYAHSDTGTTSIYVKADVVLDEKRDGENMHLALEVVDAIHLDEFFASTSFFCGDNEVENKDGYTVVGSDKIWRSEERIQYENDLAKKLPYDGLPIEDADLTILGVPTKAEKCRDFEHMQVDRKVIFYEWQYYANGRTRYFDALGKYNEETSKWEITGISESDIVDWYMAQSPK